MKNDSIIMNIHHSTDVAFKNDVLQSATVRVNGIIDNFSRLTANYQSKVEEINRAVSEIFWNIEEKKAYKDDGFKSVAEYAEKVFGYKSDKAYQLMRAGRMYADKDIPDEMKSLSTSKIAELSALSADEIIKGVQKGYFSPNSTQDELRGGAARIKEERPVKNGKIMPAIKYDIIIAMYGKRFPIDAVAEYDFEKSIVTTSLKATNNDPKNWQDSDIEFIAGFKAKDFMFLGEERYNLYMLEGLPVVMGYRKHVEPKAKKSKNGKAIDVDYTDIPIEELKKILAQRLAEEEEEG